MAKESILKFLSFLAFWFAGQVFAVESAGVLPAEQAFQFTYQVKKADRLLLSWDIATGYYLYRHKFNFVSLTPGITVGEQSFPASHTKHDEFFGDVEIFRDHLKVEVLLYRQDPKFNTLTLEVAFQGCADMDVCYMPLSKTVAFDLPTESTDKKDITTAIDQPAVFVSEQDRIAAALKNQSAWFISLSFLGLGLLLAFTPCIFPMLPILSGIVVGQGSNLNTRRAFWLSLSYILASALTYTGFGVLAGLFGSNLQALFQEPWVIMAFSGVFVLLALSMFGGFQIQIPLKLLYDTQNGKVLGAQALGESGVARRIIDILSAFIQMGATVYDLEEAELCYAPQFDANKDPVNLAGMIAANHLRGNHPLARWEELMDMHVQVVENQDEASQLLALILDDPFAQAQIVDVRTAAEFQQKHIPHAVNIPLDSFRDRLQELSQEFEIWVVCGIGQRAYNATRMLQQNGFRVRNLSGGMQTFNTYASTQVGLYLLKNTAKP